MSGTLWSKFYWSDWESDPALRLCSYAAQGLWMRMLCIASAHDPIGYVAVAGRGLDETAIARMTGGSESEVTALLGELDRNGVFSRDRNGRIYSRRMVNDAKRAAIARKNGQKGGNPSLSKETGKPARDNPPDNPRLKTQKPEARNQIPPKAPKGAEEHPLTEAVWQAANRASHNRSGRQAVSSAISNALDEGATPEAIMDAVVSHCRAQGDYAKGTHRIITGKLWRDFQPTSRQADPAVQAERVRHFNKTGEWRSDWGDRPREAA